MIIGIGTDIVNIDRIKTIHERHGQRFLDRCFTAEEQELMGGSPEAIAKRYAGKEAAAKAVQTGIGAHIGFHDFEITRTPAGAPKLTLSQSAESYIAKKFISTDGFWVIRAHISLSDEPPYAQAYVIIEAIIA